VRRRRRSSAALRAAGGVRAEAARLLGVDPHDLAYDLREHEIALG
jgi:transcriptional regulator with GAF, ATPase, and Fis domain